MLCGRKAIHEALVTKSIDFADRPKFHIDTLTNPYSKGAVSVSSSTLSSSLIN